MISRLILISLSVISCLLIWLYINDSKANFNQINVQLPYSNEKIVILKADDLHLFYGNIPPRFLRYINFVQNQGLATGLGLIASSLLDAEQESIQQLKNLASNSETFEIWLHGWYHQWGSFKPVPLYEAEFRGSGLELQTLFLKWSLGLTKLVLGVELHTFGAPGNAFDDTTALALEKFPSIKVWLYGPSNTKLFVLTRPPDIFVEPTVRDVIDPNEFKRRWESYAAKYHVLTFQLHPGNWDDKDWSRFEEIIRFLKSQPNVRFMTPYGYYLYKQSQSKVEQLSDWASDFELRQNYPNPFNPSTTIEFSIPKRANVKLVVYDISGRVVKTLIDGEVYGPGVYRIKWDGVNDYGEYVSSGVYLYKLQADEFITTKKMIIAK